MVIDEKLSQHDAEMIIVERRWCYTDDWTPDDLWLAAALLIAGSHPEPPDAETMWPDAETWDRLNRYEVESEIKRQQPHLEGWHDLINLRMELEEWHIHGR